MKKKVVYPHCQSDEGFAEVDVIPGLADGYPELQVDGTIDFRFVGDTKIFWDDQKAEHDPPQYYCASCEQYFTVFTVVNVEDPTGAA